MNLVARLLAVQAAVPTDTVLTAAIPTTAVAEPKYGVWEHRLQ